MMRLAVFILSVAVASSAASLPCQFYISPTGSDSNPGTAALPFASLAGGINITTLTLPFQFTPAVFCYTPGSYVISNIQQRCPSPYPQIVARSEPEDVTSVQVAGEAYYLVCAAIRISHITMNDKLTIVLNPGIAYPPPPFQVDPNWGCHFSHVRVNTGSIACSASLQICGTFYGFPFLLTDSVFDGASAPSNAEPVVKFVNSAEQGGAITLRNVTFTGIRSDGAMSNALVHVESRSMRTGSQADTITLDNVRMLSCSNLGVYESPITIIAGWNPVLVTGSVFRDNSALIFNETYNPIVSVQWANPSDTLQPPTYADSNSALFMVFNSEFTRNTLSGALSIDFDTYMGQNILFQNSIWTGNVVFNDTSIDFVDYDDNPIATLQIEPAPGIMIFAEQTALASSKITFDTCSFDCNYRQKIDPDNASPPENEPFPAVSIAYADALGQAGWTPVVVNTIVNPTATCQPECERSGDTTPCGGLFECNSICPVGTSPASTPATCSIAQADRCEACAAGTTGRIVDGVAQCADCETFWHTSKPGSVNGCTVWRSQGSGAVVGIVLSIIFVIAVGCFFYRRQKGPSRSVNSDLGVTDRAGAYKPVQLP